MTLPTDVALAQAVHDLQQRVKELEVEIQKPRQNVLVGGIADITKVQADSDYVNVSGDTMTGTLTHENTDAVSDSYAKSELATLGDLDGGGNRAEPFLKWEYQNPIGTTLTRFRMRVEPTSPNIVYFQIYDATLASWATVLAMFRDEVTPLSSILLGEQLALSPFTGTTLPSAGSVALMCTQDSNYNPNSRDRLFAGLYREGTLDWRDISATKMAWYGDWRFTASDMETYTDSPLYVHSNHQVLLETDTLELEVT